MYHVGLIVQRLQQLDGHPEAVLVVLNLLRVDVEQQLVAAVAAEAVGHEARADVAVGVSHVVHAVREQRRLRQLLLATRLSPCM